MRGGIGPHDDLRFLLGQELHAGKDSGDEHGKGHCKLQDGAAGQQHGEEGIDSATGEGERAGSIELVLRIFQPKVEIGAQAWARFGFGELVESDQCLLQAGPLALAIETGFKVVADVGGFVGRQGAGLVVDEGILNALAIHGEKEESLGRRGRSAGELEETVA